MPRKKKFDKNGSTLEYTQEYFKQKGEEALIEAKKVEKMHVNDGMVWVREGKTMRLVKINKE